MKSALEIRGSLLARNTFLNFIGQVIPLAVGLITIPYIVHGLGVERFGILSLAWVILGYFSLFDLGLGRATTKFVAEALGAGETERIPQILWTSLLVQVGLGTIAGIILTVCTPFLVESVLKIPSHLTKEATKTFYLLAFSVPIIIFTINLRGALEAAQRFDLVNLVKIPLSSCNFLIPAFAVHFGFGLPGIIVLLNLSWLISMIIYGLINLRLYPGFRRLSFNPSYLRPLLNFGGWVTLCNLLIPILVYFDRFLIGVLISVEAVAYYTAPYEVAYRLLIIPGVLATTLFPAWSTLSRIDPTKRNILYSRSLKYILLILGPIVAIVAVFSGEILRWWLGDSFAEKSSRVFQFLVVGMLLNALAQMPANVLDAIGRPDIRAKVFLSYVPIYLIMLWFLITQYGIVGAALAWLLRAGLELILFVVVVSKYINISPSWLVSNGLARVVMIYGLLIGILIGSHYVLDGITAKGLAMVIALLFFIIMVLRYGLENEEQQIINSKIDKVLRQWAILKKY